MISLILAMDNHGSIGNDGDLPWGRTMKADLARFKELTTGHTIIMGRKTFESLPDVLPKRHHFVLTRDVSWNYEHPLVSPFYDADMLIKYAKEADKEIFVIGGAEIYNLFLPHADKIYATRIFGNFQSDTKFFMDINTGWQKEAQKKQYADKDNAYAYQFHTFTRCQKRKVD